MHLATAPKSNAAYLGDRPRAGRRAGRPIGSVPAHLRDAHYAGRQVLGHGTGYVYAHDQPPRRRRRSSTCPTSSSDAATTEPSDRGFERARRGTAGPGIRAILDAP